MDRGLVRSREAGKLALRLCDVVGGGADRFGVAVADGVDVEVEGEPLEQGLGRTFVVDAFVQCDEDEAGLQPFGHAVAFDTDRAVLKRACQSRGDAGVQPLGHRCDQDAAVCLGQQSLLQDPLARPQRRREIEPAQQAVVADAGRKPTPRRA